MKQLLLLLLLLTAGCSRTIHYSGNPVFPGWYADPEGTVFGKKYWIYPTYSAPYNKTEDGDTATSQNLRMILQVSSLCQTDRFSGRLPPKAMSRDHSCSSAKCKGSLHRPDGI